MAPLKPVYGQTSEKSGPPLHDRKVMAPLKPAGVHEVEQAILALHDRKVMAPLKLADAGARPLLCNQLSMTGRSWPH